MAKKERYENNNKGTVEVKNHDTPTEEDKKEEEGLGESQAIKLDDRKEEENDGAQTVSTIGVTEMDKNQIDLNMLNQETETEFNNDDSKHSKTGARNHFVNYLDHTCMKCTPINLMQKKKGILSLYELCKLLLGCNNDTCATLASYTKMHAYFKKFHSAGNLKVMKTEADNQVTF